MGRSEPQHIENLNVGPEKQNDWWDEIDADERAEIEERLAQADRGEGIPHEEVMAKYQKWRK